MGEHSNYANSPEGRAAFRKAMGDRYYVYADLLRKAKIAALAKQQKRSERLAKKRKITAEPKDNVTTSEQLKLANLTRTKLDFNNPATQHRVETEMRGLDHEEEMKLLEKDNPEAYWNMQMLKNKDWVNPVLIGPAGNYTEEERAKRQADFEYELTKLRELEDLDAAYTIMNNPYNPIGWIPGVRSMVNAGVDQRYKSLTGQRSSPYTLGTVASITGDAVGLGFGFGSPLSQGMAYGGYVAGRLLGEQFGYPETGGIVGSLIGGFTPSLSSRLTFSNRFSPQGFRIGNNNYKLTYTPQGTLSFGGLGELKGVKLLRTPIWQLKDLPGLLIKSLLKGSPLEKLLSKLGTISLKQLQAYIGKNDVPAIDKKLIGRVLLNHANDTHIDYNTLRQEVLDMIPLFDKMSEPGYANYGIDRLGFNRYFGNIAFGRDEFDNPFNVTISEDPEYTLNTFTFKNPLINGADDHYDNVLGHSRTYTTKQEPNVLYVMESLSDWALNSTPFKPRFRYNIAENGNTNVMFDDNGLYYYVSDGTGMPYKLFVDASLFPFGIAQNQYRLKASTVEDLIPHMQKSYLQRQLQENLRYAAQNGQTKMRYPTPETAAKIEGYSKYPTAEYKQVLDDLDHLDVPALNNDPEIRAEIANLKQKKLQLEQSGTDSYYRPGHQTILKKYADFPKQFLKLFGKLAEVRTVVDDKGNSWYEVDVPKNYLDGTAEILFKKGGSLVKRFKNRNR